ncbi:MAG: autotransporter domain-containing protein [Elusimicrobia bacterium]|nr:autotransporter domain-containing protein [Elusimicrobiota bacterium]
MESVQTDPQAGKIVIESGAILITSATYVKADNHIAIADGGTLELTGGNNINNINTSLAEEDILTGTLIISGTDNTTNSGNIAVSTITVNPDISLTNEDGYYIATKTIEGNELINNGLFILNASKDSDYGLTNLTGVGTSSITVESGKTVTMNNTGTIEQTTIETYGDGTLVLTGNNIIANVVNYMTGNCLDIATRIVGTLDNNPANEETQGVVNILDGGSISGQITNSTGTISIYTNFEVETGITSNNTSDITKNIINIGSATAAGVVKSSNTIEYQTITVSSGSLQMHNAGKEIDDGTIQNSSITVATDGLLSVRADKLINISNPITNNGIVDLYGTDVVNVSTITGSGELQINGSIANQEGTKINQSTVTIAQGYSLTANANDITTTGKGIVNDGTLIFTTESTDTMVNTSTITAASSGNGYLIIDGVLENTANVEQDEIYVTEEGELGNNKETTIKARDIINDNVIENEGNIISDALHNNSELENEGEVTLKYLYNKYYVKNESDEGTATITAETIINDSENPASQSAYIENYEDSMIVAGTIISSGTIANAGMITSSVTFTNYGSVENSSGMIVANDFINEEDASVDNYTDAGIAAAGELINKGTVASSGTIVATKLTNSGMIVSSGAISGINIINEAGGVIESYRTNEDSEETYEGGTITSTNTAINKGIITANASGVDAKIQNENGGIYNITGGTVTKDVSGANGGTVNIKQSSVTLAEDAFISQNTINLEGTEFKLEKESNLRTSDLNIGEGATFNIMNDSVDTVDINSLNVGDGITWNFKFDVNLKLGTTDYLQNTSFANTSTMTINTINVLEDSDKATTTKLTIADSYSWADVTNPIYATTNVKYTIEQDLSITTATVLGITSEGYGGFPSAVYDGLGLYFVSGDSEGVHIENVKKWVDDGHGPQDTLIADMSLNGLYADSVLVSSPDAGTLTGVKTGSFTLRINDNEEAQGLTIKGFEDAITVNATDGRLEANNVVFSSNTGTAVITNEGITVLNGVTFDDTNTATYDVLNNGDLLLETSSSTFTKGIVGEGTTTIKGVAIDMGDATLAQGTVEISHVEGSSLTVKVDKLQYEREGSSEATVTNLIINNNELVLVGNEDDEVATLATEIKGFGNTELQKNMYVTKDISQTNINLIGATVSVSTETGAKVKATTITVDENSSLTADASNIDTFATNGGINNEGSVTFVGGTNNNTITGNQGKIFIEMNKEVINSTGTQISQQYIEVKEGGKFVMNADDVETATDGDLKGIQNNGDLEITGGTNKNIIGRGDAVKGNTIISGIVTNAEGTSVEQSTITINSGASLTASANDLKKATNGVLNSGDLIFVGSSDMINENDITGEGNLTIKSNMTSSTTITQTNIDIVDGTFTHNVADNGDLPKITAANISVSTSATFVVHSEVEVSDKVTNDGIFKINVLDPDGGADEVVSQNNIIGKGDMIISSTNYKNDGGTISQRTFTIEDADSSFETDITKFEAYNGITDNGNLIYTGTGTSSSTITGTGELTIGTADTTAEVVNKEGNEISLSTITVNEGSKFKTSANDITTTTGMVNDAEVTFTGGVNKSTITMTNGNGILNIEDDLTNQAAITQKEIDIKGGDFENVRTSSVTAEKITVADGSKLITDAKDLDISDSITITGEKTVLNLKDEEEAEIGAVITGSGKIVKEGEGTVTLSGENGYTGTTTITGGALRIVAANGISEEKIYMDGGKFITGENSEITLSNEILGTDHNDVNIETEEGGSLILDGEIFGNKDLVKTGTGLLDLQMTSNSYAGDTKISSGTVRGTTKNINGKVIGSGAADSTVEFYDADGEVVLNEFDTEKFIGTFNKTGASTMTVTNHFKALNANVLSGTFVINNDSESGSGSTFEVTETMRVENALLKGYGNITTGDLIIGQGATFAPGNSTTTFKVDGNLAFEEDGEYDVEFGQFNMDEAGHYSDNTAVTGNTTIGENAKITLNNLEGKYYVPETIDLINSDGTLADGYEYKEENVVFNDNDATDLRPGYDTRISTRVYTEGNALKIELQRKKSEYSDSLEFERSHNEQEAANAIDTISTGNPGDITKPLDAMEKMYYYQDTYDIDGLKDALNDIAGVIHANSTMLTFTNAKIEHVYDKVQERTKDILPCQKAHDKIWAEYYYNTYQVNENENSPKFDTSVNGFLVGFDMISAKNLTMGIMAGYGTSELKELKDKTTMNDINLGFYGGYETNKWLFKGMLLGGYEQYSTERTIGFMDRIANSEHNGYNAALDLEAGYKISLNKKDSQAKHKMYLKPYLGVTGSYINNEGFEEKGADSLNLKVKDYSNFAAQARAGIGINGKVKKFGWYAKAGVRQFLTEDYNEIESSLLDYQDQTKMKIRSAELDKFSYGGGLGADFALSNAWTIFANGLASFADKSTNYYGNIGLMYKFGCPNNEKKTDEDVEKISAMLNEKITEEEALKRQLAEKDKELKDAKNREKELQNRIQKYEANVVSEQQAQKMKQNTVKTFRLGEKPTFVFGTDKLNGSGKESLKQVARELESYPDAEVLVEGHTDNVGGDEINQKISENRASAVATTLKKDYGVKNNISVIGKGKTEPIASNDTAEGRAKNRRVEVIVTTNE